MQQTDFVYRNAAESTGNRTVAIFSDDPDIALLREEVAITGFRVTTIGDLKDFVAPEDDYAEVLILRCAGESADLFAALDYFERNMGASWSHALVVTEIDLLDRVYAATKDYRAAILVGSTQAERLVALSVIRNELGLNRLREETGGGDSLQHLARQIDALSQKLSDALEKPAARSAFFASPADEYAAEPAQPPATGKRRSRPPLPDPALVRQVIANRRLRAALFDQPLFSDPAWDMLLDLTAARAERKRVSVSSLCIASGVPPTTALRWITQMTEAGLLERVEDDTDRRRVFIALSDRAAAAMARYFEQLGRDSGQFS